MELPVSVLYPLLIREVLYIIQGPAGGLRKTEDTDPPFFHLIFVRPKKTFSEVLLRSWSKKLVNSTESGASRFWRPYSVCFRKISQNQTNHNQDWEKAVHRTGQSAQSIFLTVPALFLCSVTKFSLEFPHLLDHVPVLCA